MFVRLVAHVVSDTSQFSASPWLKDITSLVSHHKSPIEISQSLPWNLIFHQTIFHLLQVLQGNKLVHNLELIVIVPSCHLAVQCLGGRVQHTAHPIPRPILVQVCRRATLVVWKSRFMPVCNSIRHVREESAEEGHISLDAIISLCTSMDI